MSAFAALLQRDLRLAARAGGGGATGVVFFLILVTVVPFGVGPDPALLARIGPAMLWIGALLAVLLGLDRLFQADDEDGSLDLMLASPLPLELVVAAKCLAHFLVAGLPLVLAAPMLGLMLGLDGGAILVTTATLLVGTPALASLGAVGAALTVSLRRGGLLLPVLVLPFAIPILIFGVAVTSGTLIVGAPVLTPFLILCGLSLGMVALAPIAAAAALAAARE